MDKIIFVTLDSITDLDGLPHVNPKRDKHLGQVMVAFIKKYILEEDYIARIFKYNDDRPNMNHLRTSMIVKVEDGEKLKLYTLNSIYTFDKKHNLTRCEQKKLITSFRMYLDFIKGIENELLR